MEPNKFNKYLKEENYVHCSICGNFRNMNSFAHRKSAAHQKRLKVKLRKIIYYLSQAKKKPAIIHDADWPEKDFKRFCHFCGDQYAEHHIEDEFVVECLGCLYHYADVRHSEFVKSFLKRNYQEERADKFCLKSQELEIYLEKVSDAKKKYLKKIDILTALAVKKIRDVEEERKKLVINEIQEQATLIEELPCSSTKTTNRIKFQIPLHEDLNKIPPWLEDISSQDSEHESRSVIGPTMDTLRKHVVAQKKKGLSTKRIGANFKHHSQGSSKWLPSFQGVWNKGHRKQMKNQFNRRNAEK